MQTIRNARIVDGTGNPWYRGDVAVKGDTIARIAPSIRAPPTRVIDAQDRILSPGFIDVHTHAARGIFERPTADNYFSVGQPHGTVKTLLAKLEATPRSINIGAFLGQGSVRYDNPHQYAVGYDSVIVSGEVVFENGAMTAARPGRVLYGPGKEN